MKKVKNGIVTAIVLLTIGTIIYLIFVSGDIKQYAQSVKTVATVPAPNNSFNEVLGKLIDTIMLSN
jgi:hypothetical protein